MRGSGEAGKGRWLAILHDGRRGCVRACVCGGGGAQPVGGVDHVAAEEALEGRVVVLRPARQPLEPAQAVTALAQLPASL